MLFGQSDVRANSPKGTDFISELLRGVDAFAKRERAGIVVEENLVFAGKTLVDSRDAWVLLVKPCALDIGLLLGIK